MLIRFVIKIICFLLSIKFAFADIVDVNNEQIKELSKIKNVSYINSIKDSVKESDLVIIHTEWNDFKSINFKSLVRGKKFIIYDMRNIYSPSKIRNQGFKYYSIGR